VNRRTVPTNLEITKKAYDDYQVGDLEAVWAADDPEIQVFISVLFTPRVAVNLEGYKGYVDAIAKTWPDFRLENHEYYEGEDGKTLCVVDVYGTRADNGDRLMHRMAWLWAFRQGKFFRGWEYANPEEAKRALAW
jgi:ketosteroid isomerase-like protein